MFVALLAALGTSSLLRPGLSSSSKSLRGFALALGCLAVALVIWEGSGVLPQPEVPAIPAALVDIPGPQLHLPTDDLKDVVYVYWSTEGFPRLANGYSGFTPTALSDLRAAVTQFPDPASVHALAQICIPVVVFHPDLAAGTPWQDVSSRPVDGLGITTEMREGLEVFHVPCDRG
jgi:hypothetical protein